jgi:hypothetical protein
MSYHDKNSAIMTMKADVFCTAFLEFAIIDASDYLPVPHELGFPTVDDNSCRFANLDHFPNMFCALTNDVVTVVLLAS